MKHIKNNQAGFTLIEMAISTIIVGLLIAAVVFPFSVWQEQQKYEKTVSNVEDMALVVAAYRASNGHFPCPAPLDAPRDTTEYGVQTECWDTGTATGSCSADGEKVCIAESLRGPVTYDFDSDGTDDTMPSAPRVRIGTVPFRELNIPEEYAYDSYGNRILYAVTENLAWSIDDKDDADPSNDDINPFNKLAAGGISVVYEGGESRIDPPHSADFIILSHGEDQAGGFTKISGTNNGVACNADAPDGENCDHISFADINPTFFVSQRVESDNDNKHDDVAVYQMPINAPVWERSVTNAANIYSIKSKDDENSRVGTDYLYDFFADPEGSEYTEVYEDSRLWVGGNLLVEAKDGVGGEIQAKQICDRKGENCFEPKVIGGEGIKCDKDTQAGFKGFLNADADCEGDITLKCDEDGQFIKSITDGRLDCEYKPCASKTVTSCSQSFQLPDTASDTGRKFSYKAGNKYKCSEGSYECKKGEWKGGFDDKLCNCRPSSSGAIKKDCASNCKRGEIKYRKITDCDRCTIRRETISNTCRQCDEPETCEDRGDCPVETCEDRGDCPEPETCEDRGDCPEEPPVKPDGPDRPDAECKNGYMSDGSGPC